MKKLIAFFEALDANNNKEWFDAHKAEYLEAKAELDELALRFLKGVESFDDRVQGLGLKDITYRIYRDIRFSPDKTPYKNWCGVYVCPKGKKSGMAGYYIHFEPHNDTYFLCGGLYNPTKEVIASVRDEIMCSPEEFHEAILGCEGFHLNWETALRKMPKGWDETDPHSEYYRLRSYEVYKPLSRADVLREDYLERAIADLKLCQPFNEILNRCFDFAIEEAAEGKA